MRRFFAPEVVQTSTLDCGPAALKSLLEGFGIHTSYGRLREACQTGLDGTSIDTMELVANSLGLEAEQLLLPVDHVLLAASKALPAIAVVTLADGLSHFVVVWRRHGSWLQIMDPAVGRRWISVTQFAGDLYRHRMPVPASGWREFAGSDEFLRALFSRLTQARVDSSSAKEEIRKATADASWHSLAALDAACRALAAIQIAQPLRNSSRALGVLRSLCAKPAAIPAQYWSVRPVEGSQEAEEHVWMCGAVLVRALKRRPESTAESLSPELASAASEAPASAFRHAFRYLRGFGWFTPVYLCLAIAAVAGGMLIETLLFRGLFDFAGELHIPGQRLGAVAALALFSLVVFLLEVFSFTGTARLSRWLETSFRMAFLRKIPLLPDRYFQSRLQSDMGERSHSTHRLRHLPDICRSLLSSITQLIATAAGMIWLEPGAAPFVLFAVAAALLHACAGRAFLNEADLRVRTHAGGLTRFYLDAALGLASIRAHGAENNLRRAHSTLVEKWVAAALRLQRAVARLDSLQITAMFAAIATMFLLHPLQGSNVGRLLLFAYWALNLPTIGQNIGVLVRQIPSYRSLILRVVEPIGSEEEAVSQTLAPLPKPPALHFEGVAAEASGHRILDNIDLKIPAGSHVAVVGASGAGKVQLNRHAARLAPAQTWPDSDRRRALRSCTDSPLVRLGRSSHSDLESIALRQPHLRIECRRQGSGRSSRRRSSPCRAAGSA